MPIRPDVLETLLNKAGYPPNLTKEVVDGFRKGFDIGYRGPTNRQHTSKNLPFRVGDSTELWNKVMK